jgi:hypothetical protein
MASEYEAHRCISSCILLLVGAVLLLSAGTGSSASCYKRIFTFGDSIIDTGNFMQLIGHNPSPIKEPPYGMTFFHHPTGRICDGRVLIDFYGEYNRHANFPVYVYGVTSASLLYVPLH